MSDEFEDISVVETEPVESGAPVDASAEAVPPEVTPPEVTPAEVAATKVNLDAGDEALKQNSQTAYLEANAPDRVNESGAAVTLAGIAAKEADKEEKRAQAFEHSQEEMKRSEARRDFMNKEHDFGDMKMSGADLEKVLNYISDPKVQEKLRERMGKSGMSKERVDKGMKELNEYAAIKKKEAEGKATTEDQRRLLEIKNSTDFKEATRAVDQELKKNGIDLSGNKTKEVIVAQTADTSNAGTAASDQAVENNSNSVADASKSKKTAESQAGMKAAYAHFSTAPHLGDEFAAKVGGGNTAPAANDMNSGFDTTTPAAVVAQAKPKVAVDLSFG